MTMTNDQRKEFLTSVGLNPDAPALEGLPARPAASAVAASPVAGIKLAPEGVDPHTMPVDEIVFDPRLVEQFPSLAPKDRAPAAAYLFSLYKGKRGEDRNKVLHQAIGRFLVNEHRSRETGGLVKEKIAVDSETKDLAMVLKAKGVSVKDLIALLEKE